jgi:hypothetical protein
VAHWANNLINRVLNAISGGLGWTRWLKIESGGDRRSHVVERFLRHQLHPTSRMVTDLDEAKLFR